ncbi:hypothetical protein F5X99DRAFT_10946 [Biscogniauxia marginata]|nr:hypothetical protein F5X99DRAFT_10946 [Biscogniauxia marginata]
MTGAFGTPHGTTPPVPQNPMPLIPGGDARQAAPGPLVIEPLGLKNYEDLRSCLLEWGNRGGMATLPLQRVTFFRTSPRQEKAPHAPIPGWDAGFRHNDIKAFFAEDGLLTVNAVTIPDKHAVPKEWIWFELKQPLAEIHGNVPAEFQDRPRAWMIMALPSENSYFYSWHDARVQDKAEMMQGLGMYDPRYDAGLSRAPPGVGTYFVWSTGGLPSMQFSPKPQFISDLVQGSGEEFFGIPFIGPYPRMVDPTSEEARNWWGNLGTEMSRDANRWRYIRELMKKGLLGIEVMSTKQAWQEWVRARAMIAARQWTHSPAAGALEEFQPLVDPKSMPSAGNPHDAKRPSGLRNEVLAESPQVDPTSSGEV